MTDPLTPEEKAWLRKVQKLLDNCPSRFGFYTIGDPQLQVFDRSNEHLYDQNVDMVCEVSKYDDYLCRLKFHSPVHGVCG